MQHGEVKLAQVCGIIALDEKRHETACTKIAEKHFDLDPNEMVIAFRRHDEEENRNASPFDVQKLTGLTSEGREARDYVCRLAQRMRRLEERAMAKDQKAPTIPFSWISGRVV
nr:stearoyl-[acyl-carrier-protein] 9-desaturase, chloroplastic [Quercus suber]